MERKRAHKVIIGAKELLTLANPSKTPKRGQGMDDLSLLEDGALAIRDDLIIAVGTTKEVLEQVEVTRETQVIEAKGKVVLPGLVDPHTHLLYGGDRAKELEERLKGTPYLQILKEGGGILSTVASTRKATDRELFLATKGRLLRLLGHGVTTVEIKSGYGLTVEDEIRSLDIIKELGEEGPQTIVATFLGAHAIPLEYKGDPDSYRDLVIHGMIPKVVEGGLASFCDVFCEEGVFTVEQSRKILQAAAKAGLSLKIHADEMNPLGGAELAAELGAISAEHLLHITPRGMEEMAAKGVIAVLLPGTAFYLGEEYAPARAMIDKGIPIALSTDFNPGSSPIESPWIIMGLAVLKMGMSINEAINAFTINGAHALGLADKLGSLEVGKMADILILDMGTYKEIPYYFGASKVERVLKAGEILL